MGPGQRCQADGPGAGNLGKEILEAVHDGEGALRGLRRLQGVDLGEAREPGNFLVPLGVVLHGAAAEGVETRVDAEVELAEAREVAHQAQFPDFGDVQLAAEEVVVRQVGGGDVQLG